jgi:hypothetical protein
VSGKTKLRNVSAKHPVSRFKNLFAAGTGFIKLLHHPGYWEPCPENINAIFPIWLILLPYAGARFILNSVRWYFAQIPE